jgi:5-methylcytosine-specific restriction endonuclease McrA
MTKGWFNYRTHKYSEYVKGHEPKRARYEWSRDYPRCINCGTTSTKYARKGLCQNCEYHLLRKNDPDKRYKRSIYFAKYYETVKRFTGYYERYRKSDSFKHQAKLRQAATGDDPDWSLFVKNKSYLLNILHKTCEVCGTSDSLEVDHVIPRKAGGKSDIENLRVLCFTHHRAIGTGRHSVLRD